MLVMGVVCAPWSCGTEKRPFDFGFGGRTYVRPGGADGGADEGADLGLARTPRFIAPEGNGAFSSPPKDAERGGAAPFGTGRPWWPVSPGPLIVLYNEWGESRWFESGDSECDRSAR